MKITKKRKNDIILLLVLLLIALGAWLFFILTAHEGEWVVVTCDGKFVAQYPLSKDTEVRLDSDNGGYNILVIEDGYASVSEASCPDKLCVHQHKIHCSNETIVCLPNKTVISVASDKEAEADLVG